uniref:Uncharacterized protein n=1 Tax=Hucho hucho TaxID=62062 RepID=A0A4W5MBB6_9TELE
MTCSLNFLFIFFKLHCWLGPVSKNFTVRSSPVVFGALEVQCLYISDILYCGVTQAYFSQGTKHRNHITVLRCLRCGQSKRFLNNRLWVDQPEAQLENQSQPVEGESRPISKKSSTGPSSTQHQVPPSKPRT